MIPTIAPAIPKKILILSHSFTLSLFFRRALLRKKWTIRIINEHGKSVTENKAQKKGL